jgi:diacylglycerol O-acyltransferase / trehalose O-mycolyltransferase
VPGTARAAAVAWPACIARTAPVHIGVTQVSRTRAGRLVTLRLRSRAMGDVQPVRVLLPEHYDASGRTRYPVLYLLHGANADETMWLDQQHIDRQLGDLPIIAVMPNGSQNGQNGGYSDWFGTPAAGGATAPAWESFHIRELVPFIDAHFPTRASAGGRAIAGISMGGGGAAKYAAEYPGTFGYVGAFSGETDPLLPAAIAFQDKTCKWGDPALEPVRWQDNDATSLAGNLRGVRVFIRSGDGTPGPFDSPQPPGDPTQAAIRQYVLLIELGAHLENQNFAAALKSHGVRDVDVRFFHGSHTRRYWIRDTTSFVAWLRVQLRRPVKAPKRFRVMSAHRWFTAWGWTFTVRRHGEGFVHVSVSGHAITATGSGAVRAVSPPQAHGRPFALTLNLGAGGTRHATWGPPKRAPRAQ